MMRPVVTPLEDGVYRVETDDGGTALVYVARSGTSWWAFSNGEQFHGSLEAPRASTRIRGAARTAHQPVTSPMPATVRSILVAAGDIVQKGATLVIVEAMKMELPLRAPIDGLVTAVNCRESELVQPDVPLVEVRAQ